MPFDRLPTWSSVLPSMKARPECEKGSECDDTLDGHLEKRSESRDLSGAKWRNGLREDVPGQVCIEADIMPFAPPLAFPEHSRQHRRAAGEPSDSAGSGPYIGSTTGRGARSVPLSEREECAEPREHRQSAQQAEPDDECGAIRRAHDVDRKEPREIDSLPRKHCPGRGHRADDA